MSADRRSSAQSRRRWLRPLAWLSGAAALIALIVISAVLAATGPLGRELVRDQLDGRQIAGFGVLEVGAVRGNVLRRFSIDTLALRTEDGVWLSVDDLSVRWDAAALLTRRIEVEALSVARVDVLRRPERAPTQGGGGSFGWDINLSDAAIETLHLAEGVAGRQAAYALTAGFGRINGAWDGRLNAARLDAAGDTIDARFEYGDTLSVDARLQAAPGGPLANLLRAGDVGADAVIEASGGLDAGSGEAVLDVGGAQALRFTAQWSPDMLTAQGRVTPARWAQFARLETLLGGPADLALELPLEGGLSAPVPVSATIRLDAPDAALTARPQAGRVIAVDGRAGPGLVAAATGGSVAVEVVRLERGELDLSGEHWRVSGDVSAAQVDLPGGYGADRVSGPLTIQGPAGRLTVQGDLALVGARYDLEPLAGLLGAAPRVEARLTYEAGADQLSVDEARIDAAAGRLAASGVLQLADRRFDLTMSSEALDPSALTDQLTGRGSVRVEAQGGFDGAAGFTLSASGFQPAGALGERLDGPLRAEVDARRTSGGDLTFERVQVQSPDLVVDAAGSQNRAGFQLAGEAIYSGRSPVAGVSLAGTLELAFEAQSGADGVAGRVDARAGQLAAGPLAVESARLRADLSGPLDALSGEARFTGESARGPVDLAADYSRRGDQLSLTRLSGRAAGFGVEGAADIAPGAAAADLTITPTAGFGALALQARLADGALDVTAEASDLIAGDMSYFNQLTVTLAGPLERVQISLLADGAYGAPFAFDAGGWVRLAGGPLETELSLDGEYGQIPIASRAPITLSGGDPLTAAVDLGVGDGGVRLSYRGGEASRLTARFQNVPAAVLSLRRAREPVSGALSGELALSRADGVWTGQGLLQGEGLRPSDQPAERALDGAVTLDLNTERLEVGARADGPDFTALGDAVVRTGPVSGPAALTRPDNGVTGQLDVDGRIGPFAAFHLGAGQRLSGDVRVDARVSGTIGAPDLTGEAALTQARFSDSRAGLVLEDLVLRARFTQSRAEITEFSADDGQGGTLTGGGTLEFAGALGGEARASFDSFRLIDRDFVSAVGTGEAVFTLDGGQGRLSGAATLERAEVSPPDSGRPSIPRIEVSEINVPAGVRAPQDGAGAGGLEIALDYQVSAPRRVFVRGSNFDTEWGLEVQISGTVSDPQVFGAARALRGRADLLGRVFDIESGVVRLSGDPAEARMELTAVREARDITARIEVAGPVTSPDITLGSSPSLPPDEVASRILFGEGAANLTGLQAAQLAASLASLSGGGGFDPLGALRQASGLDQLGVRQDSGGGTVVSGGRYLTDDVYLELESAGSSAAPSTNIEWELTPRFTLLSRLSANGAAGVALSWRTEYDDDPFAGGDLFDFDRLNFFGFGGEGAAEDEDALRLDDAAPEPDGEAESPVTTLQRSDG